MIQIGFDTVQFFKSLIGASLFGRFASAHLHPRLRIYPDHPLRRRDRIYNRYLIQRQKLIQLTPKNIKIGGLYLNDRFVPEYIRHITFQRNLMIIHIWFHIIFHNSVKRLFRQSSNPKTLPLIVYDLLQCLIKDLPVHSTHCLRAF